MRTEVDPGNRYVREIACDTATEFLSVMNPHDDLWRSTGGAMCWIYRGQLNARWGLQPSAMRPGAFVHYGIGASGQVSISTVEERVKEEAAVVIRFANACIRAGRPLPEDSQWLRSDALQRQVFGDKVLAQLVLGIEFPMPLLRSLYALAQHHGVPTRLLDWTGEASVGAYFACQEIARHLVDPKKYPIGDPGTHLAVWALRSRTVFTEIGEFSGSSSIVGPLRGEGRSMVGTHAA